jgi:iron(III) transport system substrate-binding protein
MAEAQRFLAFVTGAQGQRVLATTDSKEYAVGLGVASDPALPALDTLEQPDIDPSSLNGPEVVALMSRAGLL